MAQSRFQLLNSEIHQRKGRSQAGKTAKRVSSKKTAIKKPADTRLQAFLSPPSIPGVGFLQKCESNFINCHLAVQNNKNSDFRRRKEKSPQTGKGSAGEVQIQRRRIGGDRTAEYCSAKRKGNEISLYQLFTQRITAEGSIPSEQQVCADGNDIVRIAPSPAVFFAASHAAQAHCSITKAER